MRNGSCENGKLTFLYKNNSKLLFGNCSRDSDGRVVDGGGSTESNYVDVLLTVQLSITLVINQLYAQILDL